MYSPDQVIAAAKMIAQKGAWSIKDFTPKGIVLFALWGVEAAVIICVSTILSYSMLKSYIFCERCNQWIDNEKIVEPKEACANPDEMKTYLEQGNFTSLMALKKAETDSMDFTEIQINHCPRCRQLFLLSLKSVTLKVDKKGKVEKQEKDIVKNLLIESGVFDPLSKDVIRPDDTASIPES
jgi:hypothetical protein